ncbi:hypothetical protein FIBSPDRAFT_1036451 [Athelia psychrophila]|uniref:Uncharacterized protein n=1 Tax=Athelia psychrophila TaxID=1759441 RepID=A0A166VJI7_9AGAM|nr:hypothetical protein FIBSPDRAFT_1036451 [Fibularhizoctonia sp. CBS 109695]
MSDSGSEVKSRAESHLQARKEAQRDGIFAGVTSALTSAIIGQRLMGFGKKTTLFCGLTTGVLSGYYFTQAFVDANLARLTKQEEAIYAAERASKREGRQI